MAFPSLLDLSNNLEYKYERSGRCQEMYGMLIRPFKINCLFWASAGLGIVLILTKTHTVESTIFPGRRAFFGLEIRPVVSEKNAF